MPSDGYRINAGRKKKSESMPKLESTKSGEVVEILDFGIVLILELTPSIGPLESRFHWYLMKEFFIK